MLCSLLGKEMKTSHRMSAFVCVCYTCCVVVPFYWFQIITAIMLLCLDSCSTSSVYSTAEKSEALKCAGFSFYIFHNITQIAVAIMVITLTLITFIHQFIHKHTSIELIKIYKQSKQQPGWRQKYPRNMKTNHISTQNLVIKMSLKYGRCSGSGLRER